MRWRMVGRAGPNSIPVTGRDRILGGIGYSAADLARLREAGTIG